MNQVLKLAAAAAALAGLSACDMLGLNRGGSNNATTATNNTANASANASADAGGKDPSAGNVATASTAPFTGEVNAQFLVGSWTDDGNCANAIEFRSDGTFVTSDGNGTWALDGDRLIFQGERTVSARVQAPNQDTITLLHDDGTLGRSTRCP